MTRNSVLPLAFLFAAFGTLDTARAGTSITYNWVTPSFTNGVHYSGFIAVDSTGISSTPIDLTAAMILTWQISVFDSTNTLLFSLSDPPDFIVEFVTHVGTEASTAPKITTTSIFLPVLTLSDGEISNRALFALAPGISQNPAVSWASNLGNATATVAGTVSPTVPVPSQTTAGAFDSTGTPVASFSTSPDTEIDIATVVPEPASLAIWSLAAAVAVGFAGTRRRASAAAA